MQKAQTRHGWFARTVSRSGIRRTWPLMAMLILPLILLIVFRYIPLAGLRLAFVRYNPVRGIWGSPWIGLKNFEKLFEMAKFWTILKNTLVIAVQKILANLFIALFYALLLTEIRSKRASKFFQSMMLFPWFVSWIILSTIFLNIFSLNGAVNSLLVSLGLERVPFLISNGPFRFLIVLSDAWKGMGYYMVIFVTAIYGIDEGLYEAATVDGANKLQQKLHITIPGIGPMIVLVLILSVGSILNAGFDQIYALYNSSVYDSAEIIDTYVYKVGLESAQYALGAAVGMFKSAVSGVLVIISYYLADRLANYKVF
jgi:putative aldouronate transport system permease protein